MELNFFSLVFLAVLYGGLVTQLWLNHRQRKHLARHAGEVPEPFLEQVSQDEHRRAAAYATEHNRIRDPELVIASLLPLWWTLGGGIEMLSAWLPSDPGVLTGGGAILAVLVLNILVLLPFQVWRTFGVEQAYGFNRQSPASFAANTAKSGLLFLLLGGALVFGALLLMETTNHWWLWVWVLWLVFLGIAHWILPRFLLPWFHTLTPLPEGKLREQIRELLTRTGFHASNIQTLDASRDTGHGNAFFAGMGRHKRIVLFDTLIERLSPEAVTAVVAHELGHFRLSHVRRRLATSAIGSLLALGLLAWVAEQPFFHAGLGVSDAAAWTTLMLFLLVGPVFTEFFVDPLKARLSQRDEYAADRFAAEQVGADHLETALVELYRHNAVPLSADPLYTAFNASHPPPVDRIEALRAEQPPTSKEVASRG